MEQKVDELDSLMSKCLIGTDGMKNREKCRPASGNDATPGVMRQRSVFTAGKTKFNPAAPPFISRSNSFVQGHSSESAIRTLDMKHRDIPISLIGPTQLPVNSRIWNSIAARPSRSVDDSSMRNHHHASPSNHHLGRPMSARNLVLDSRPFGPCAMPNGTIQIRLRDGIRIDMTVDRAIRVVNSKEKIIIAMSGNSSSASLSHPNGQVFQHGGLVEIVGYDGMKRNNYVRFAKMWQKGISLTSEGCALIYLVDAAGTRTTSDAISFDINRDYTIPVFLSGSHQGPNFVDEAINITNNTSFWLNDDSSETFEINGYRITQTTDGLVRVTRANNRCIIRTSPNNGSATITSPFIHCTASLGATSHLFVRRGERRMHFDGASFVVRNAGHSAGFDEHNRLRVY
uniref:CSON014149 protein n=1 Tax=Culicoides sonorensis TaxID=179676 RepID=A0A336M9X0_CULSO